QLSLFTLSLAAPHFSTPTAHTIPFTPPPPQNSLFHSSILTLINIDLSLLSCCCPLLLEFIFHFHCFYPVVCLVRLRKGVSFIRSRRVFHDYRLGCISLLLFR
ncbi:hypothetical protein V8G54_007340, partial [Vigna mungo]